MSETAPQPVTTAKPELTATKPPTSFNSYVGINEAARLTRRSKGQISKDTTSGRLSHELDERGNKRYMVAELDRVYGLKTDEKPPEPAEETTPPTVEIALLKAQLAMQSETIRDLRADKEKLWEQLQHQLPAPQPAAAIMPAEPPRPKSLLDRIMNR